MHCTHNNANDRKPDGPCGWWWDDCWCQQGLFESDTVDLQRFLGPQQLQVHSGQKKGKKKKKPSQFCRNGNASLMTHPRWGRPNWSEQRTLTQITTCEERLQWRRSKAAQLKSQINWSGVSGAGWCWWCMFSLVHFGPSASFYGLSLSSCGDWE